MLGVGAAVLALLVTSVPAAYAAVSEVPDSTAQVQGSVYGMGKVGDALVIGGVFSKVGGQDRVNVAKLLPDGRTDRDFVADTDGKVMAVVASEDGSVVFLGGKFSSVNGVARANLAAVDAETGAVLTGWRADTTGRYPDVKALEVSGNLLYVAGRFGGINGTGRKRLAAVRTADGSMFMRFNPRVDRAVNEIDLTPDHSLLYLAGAFTEIKGEPRAAAGAVDTEYGVPTGFAPNETGGNAVTGALSPDGTRYFYGTDNNTLFAFDVTSNDPVWTQKTSGNTQAIAVTDDEMWIGGHFNSFKGLREKHPYMASLDPADGTVNPWNPGASGGKMGVWAFIHDGSFLHAGGVFSRFNGVQQRGYARFAELP